MQADWNSIFFTLAQEIAREVGREVRNALAAHATGAATPSQGDAQKDSRVPRRMTVRQAAEYIGVPYDTFRRWRLNNQIPVQAIKLGPRTVLYDTEDLDRWMAAMKERRPDA